jgi:hypothetical protein
MSLICEEIETKDLQKTQNTERLIRYGGIERMPES